MPIHTDCSSCGKRLKIRDEFLGRKVKCPRCGNVFVAEDDEDSTAVQAAPPKRAPVKPAKDKVAAKPAKKAPPPPDDDLGDEEDRPIKRRKKPKKVERTFSPLWLGIGAAVVLVAVLAGGYWLFFSSPSPAKKTGQTAQNQGKDREGLHRPAPANVTLADLVPGDTWLFVSVHADIANWIDMEPLRPIAAPNLALFQKSLGFPLSDIQRLSVFAVAPYTAFKTPRTPPIVLVIESKKPLDQGPIKAAVAKDPAGLSVEFLTDRMMLLTPAAVYQSYRTQKGQSKATGVLDKALIEAATSKGIVASVVMPPEVFQEAAQPLKDLPGLLKVKAAFLSLDRTDQLKLVASLAGDDGVSAKEIKASADKLVGLGQLALKSAKADKDMAAFVKISQQALQDLKVELGGNEVTLVLQADDALLKELTPIVMSGFQQVNAASATTQEINNLKQIVLAWHNYASVFKTFPPQTYRKSLSWRVAILPFIEQEALYKQFKLEEPWNSPHNLKLLPLMPKTYESMTRKAGPGQTFYQTFVGPGTVNKNPNKGMAPREITDGTSNTLIVSEGARAVQWTKPDDIVIAPGQPVGVESADGNFFLGVFADGTVRMLPRALNQQTLRWLIDPADGNVIPGFSAPKGKRR